MVFRDRARRAVRPAGALALAALLAGCAGYSQQTAETVAASRTGNIDAALASLESKNTGADKDLLYYLEKGELLRLKGTYQPSRDSWLAADDKVRQWEDDVRTDPSKVMGELGSFLLNDTTRRYDGRDYEKVFLNVRLAQDHLAMGDWNAARTEIKKMHEREALVAEFRAKELDAAEAKAKEKGLKYKSFKQLDGYPIETLEDPEVRALKNAYESAFANYLAGFVYEALGEPSLAAPGYRRAAEMRPDLPVIEDSLKGLDARISSRGTRGKTDTLFVIETGMAPAIHSQTLPLILPIPNPGGRGIDFIATPLSWPVVRPDPSTPRPGSLTVDGQVLPVALLTDVNVMARRALSDEMPGILARSAVRAISRGAAQAAMDAAANNNRDRNTGAVMGIISLITKIASVATEVADERIWRTLPANYSIARAVLPQGTHQVVLPTAMGPVTREVAVSGRYSVIALRLMDSGLYVVQPPEGPKEAEPELVQPSPAVAPAPEAAPAPKPVKKKAPKSETKPKPVEVKAQATLQ